MPNRDTVIYDIERCTCNVPDACRDCLHYTGKVGFECMENLLTDAIALLKEQETTSTGKTRIFQCEKCGYGIDDIYLSNEHDFDVYPHFCPNCGRSVK